MKVQELERNGLKFFILENDWLRVEVFPAAGGKITSLVNKKLNKEFLWHNNDLPLQKCETGADYDSNFWGGIDELLPNDIPELVDHLSYPDHGELWTTALNCEVGENKIILHGIMSISGLLYEKEISLVDDEPSVICRYRIKNKTAEKRHFLWKQHAALQISEGDYLKSSAIKAKGVDSSSNRLQSTAEFEWPVQEGIDFAQVPPKQGAMDFFYLYDTQVGEMSLLSENGAHRFTYSYDKNVFPFEWYFASYGQFRGHYVAILEPATAMPVSVAEAAKLVQCTVLAPAEELKTTINLYAGLNI